MWSRNIELDFKLLFVAASICAQCDLIGVTLFVLFLGMSMFAD